ncbi:AAA family ATPase [Agrobacterium rhizogenes]|nr:AAA family ATPase [Rhizobium rhizogenes]NTI94347.1 AAA family ATPase [Rhizobium rhizogenes]NTJ56814.1 AAA family ATPase [Rhizobium rhizogenes]OCJ30834.1 hypothetical protein A6U89_00015 [Agrobacterium sp. B133/95]
MKIQRVRIQSYKSFADSDWVELSPHFTVLVGQNNAGKSAFLQSLDVNTFEPQSHRSSKIPENAAGMASVVNLSMVVPGEELKQLALNEATFFLPTDSELADKIVSLLLDQTNTFNVTVQSFAGISFTPSTNYNFSSGNHTSCRIDVDRATRTISSMSTHQYGSAADSIPAFLTSILRDNIFFFKAERYAIGRCQMSVGNKLTPNASNLPFVLSRLNKDHRNMELFQKLVSEILPSIKRVLVWSDDNQVVISIQSHKDMRPDLAVPLNECGTGVSQVLAMIYVVVAYPAAQLIIDEPNSFLHPSATRRLLNVLRRFDQHQYILSTHSSDVIAAIQPEKLLLLRWDQAEEQTVILDNSGDDVEHLKASLTELGVGLSDVFGYDTVVFVEGPTEAECFPLLVPKGNMKAVNFVAMKEASALTKTKPDTMFAIYSKGVAGSALLPPTTRFSFDPDGRTSAQKADVIRASKGAAKFLGLPMFENYLLHPPSISTLLRRLDESGSETDTGRIQGWIDENFQRFPVKGIENTSPASCDAAKLLDALFSTLTKARHEYRKVEHGRELTRIIHAQEPEHLSDLVNYISELLEEGKSD